MIYYIGTYSSDMYCYREVSSRRSRYTKASTANNQGARELRTPTSTVQRSFKKYNIHRRPGSLVRTYISCVRIFMCNCMVNRFDRSASGDCQPVCVSDTVRLLSADCR